MVNKKSGEGLGIAGFTLGLAGFFVLLFNPFTSLFIFITGLIFCIIQQKNKKTKLGKAGLIINLVGILAGIIYLIILITYLIPIIEEINKQNILIEKGVQNELGNLFE